MQDVDGDGDLKAPFDPVDVSDLELAFPAQVRQLMPAWKDIPKEFQDWFHATNKWQKFQSQWFFSGLPADFQIIPKKGIDPEKAFRHLTAIQGSFEPKHEHKAAAVSFLASLWFEDYSNLEKSR